MRCCQPAKETKETQIRFSTSLLSPQSPTKRRGSPFPRMLEHPCSPDTSPDSVLGLNARGLSRRDAGKSVGALELLHPVNHCAKEFRLNVMKLCDGADQGKVHRRLGRQPRDVVVVLTAVRPLPAPRIHLHIFLKLIERLPVVPTSQIT